MPFKSNLLLWPDVRTVPIFGFEGRPPSVFESTRAQWVDGGTPWRLRVARALEPIARSKRPPQAPQHTEQEVVWRPPQRGGDLPFLYHPALTDPTPRHTLDTDSDHGEPTAGVHAQEHPHHGRRGLHVRAPGWRMQAEGASTMIITARSIDLDDGPLEPPDWGRAAGTD